MRKKYLAALWLAIALLCAIPVKLFAINDLTAKVPGNSTQYPAYIRNVVLVTEPHGGYVEQSMYLEYTDSYAFPGSKNVEIIHRFELPEGSVINDFWLWMDNNVMRAIMMDTWSARHIYDSVVSMKRDPAFLSKNGNQYELHVYPLVSGSTRKIKINFITPTKWTGDYAMSELPLKFLSASVSTQLPVQILFRYRDDVWGSPGINEIPGTVWTQIPDTMGYKFKNTRVNDVKSLQSFNLTFGTAFKNGAFFSSSLVPKGLNYFQLGIHPPSVFPITTQDTASRRIMAGIDLSGSYYKNFSKLIPNLRYALKTGIREIDDFNIVVAGAGKITKLSDVWLPGRSTLIDSTLDSFVASKFADSVKSSLIPNILFADQDAGIMWSFSDLSSYAVTKTYGDINSALPAFSNNYVIAAYEHGFEAPLYSLEASEIIASLDSLFLRGGRFLTYYDKNRIGRERLATNYIPSLGVLYNTTDAITLTRTTDGNISGAFPESIVHAGSYFFSYSDPTVKKELVDSQGNPCVISKKLGNGGLLVVSGIWAFNDDDALKKLLAIPLLGLNSNPHNNILELKNMLATIAGEHKKSPISQVIAFTNSDSLVTLNGTATWVSNFRKALPAPVPEFKSINLVDGSVLNPASITVSGKEFYGSGYLLQELADSAGGFEIESHLTDWPGILAKLDPSAFPEIDSVKLTASFSGPTDSLKEIREINADRTDAMRPLFFIGSTNSTNKMTVDANVWFHGFPTAKHASFIFQLAEDTLSSVNAAIMGNEKLKDLMVGSRWDTAAIVRQALKYNLLCDYTALIALEPNDTIKYMVNPFDESQMVDVKDKGLTDSLACSVYPNPFNISTVVSVHLNRPSNLKIRVYNILGREVTELLQQENANGKVNVIWNGRDAKNSVVSTGIYLITIEGKEVSTGKQFHFVRKALLLK